MKTLERQEQQQRSVSPAAKIAGIAAAVVAVMGLLILLMGKVQQSDPTLTQAPPAGPGAQTLAPSAQKSKHPGPMYVMTPSGPALNPVNAAPSQAESAPPVVMAPTAASSH